MRDGETKPRRARRKSKGFALVCRICGDSVREADLREHLVTHNPNARGMDWEDVRNVFLP
ncbi:hypothetical protein ACFLSJ_08355 [Verrucomicrobiota bacterium]